MKKILLMGLCAWYLVFFLPGCALRTPGAEKPPVPPTVTTAQELTPAPTKLPGETPAAMFTPVSPTPTPSGVSVATVMPDLASYYRQVTQMRSPDGRYTARVLLAYPTIAPNGMLAGDQFYTRVWLIGNTDNEMIQVEETWHEIGLGSSTPSILQWSLESTKLFLVDRGSPDGCGPSFNNNLRVFDLASGVKTNLNISHNGLISLTPDGRQVLIFALGEIQLVDLATFTEGIFPYETPAGEFWAVNPVWSPDGNSLLFGAIENPCSPYDTQKTWLYLVSLKSGEVRVLQKEDPTYRLAVSWPLSGLAQLSSRNGQDWWLDVPASEINQTPPPEIANAKGSLFGFFDSLNRKNYAEAVRYFGGSYEQLRYLNPEVNPDDKAGLWESACTINGYACLPIYQAILEKPPAPSQLVFRVTFSVDEAHLFEFGPCCGADITEMPSVFEFLYLIQRDPGGTWLVIDPPVFVP